MKLALIRQRYTGFGGAELYVSQLARRLADQGHEVHILARKWDGRREPGLTVIPIDCLGGPAFIRLKSFARAVARQVEKGRYDLVHSFERTWSQDIFRAGDGCHQEWLERRARVKGHGQGILDRLNPRHRAFLEVETRLFNDPRLKLVLANSQQVKQEIIRWYGFPRDRIWVVYNGVDQQRFHPGLSEIHRKPVRAELGLTENEPLLLFVGSGFARKGLAELIRALKHSQGKLLVAGRDKTAPFERLAARCGVSQRVKFLGPRAEVQRLYAAADAFVLPTLYDPFANVCLEAMASGLPVVTTEENGAVEAIQPDVNGYTANLPVNPRDLAEKIEKALKLDREILRQANNRILTEFTWEKNLETTQKAYREITG